MRVCEQLVAHKILQDGQSICQIREDTLSKKDECSICPGPGYYEAKRKCHDSSQVYIRGSERD